MKIVMLMNNTVRDLPEERARLIVERGDAKYLEGVVKKEEVKVEPVIVKPKPSKVPKKKIADIIIPHHNRHDMLKLCLDSLDNSIFNIIIVSGGTFAQNCNKGAKIATTQNLVFLNDDVIVKDSVIEDMIKRKEDIVGVPLRIPSENKTVYGMNMLWGKYGASKVLEGFDSVKTALDFNGTPQIPATGAFFLIRKKAWKALGGLQECYKNGGEDNHLFLEALEKGFTFGSIDTVCDHFHSSSEGRYDHDVENHKILTKNFPKKRLKAILGDDINGQKVSIIIPTREKTKQPDCLESVRKQTYNNIEVIIVRDKELKGANWARNKGAKNANGRYLFFCDDDIELKENAIEAMVAKLRGTSASFCYCNYNRTGVLEGKHFAKKWDVEELRKFNFASTMSLIVAKDFPGFDEKIERFQDWDLWLTMAENGKEGIYLAETLFTANYDENDISCQSETFDKWLNEVKKKHNI